MCVYKFFDNSADVFRSPGIDSEQSKFLKAQKYLSVVWSSDSYLQWDTHAKDINVCILLLIVIGPSGVQFRKQSHEKFQNWMSAKREADWNYKHDYSLNCTTQGPITNLSYVFWEVLLNENICSAFHNIMLKAVQNIAKKAIKACVIDV